jgi:hypothetical protein
MLVLEAHDEDRGDHACTCSDAERDAHHARAEYRRDAGGKDHRPGGLAAVGLVVQGTGGTVDGPGDTVGVPPSRQDALTPAPAEVRR